MARRLAKVPAVLWTDVYAAAALAGAATMVALRRLGLPPVAAAVIGGLVCFTLRVVSAWRHWSLPSIH